MQKNPVEEIAKPSRFIIGFMAAIVIVLTVCMTVLAWRFSTESMGCSCVCIVMMSLGMLIVVYAVKTLEDRYLARLYEYQRTLIETKKAEYQFSRTLLKYMAQYKMVPPSQDPPTRVVLNVEIMQDSKEG